MASLVTEDDANPLSENGDEMSPDSRGRGSLMNMNMKSFPKKNNN